MNALEQIIGKTVGNKWIVDATIDLKADDSTGGFFSVPFRVHHQETDQHAFLKVLDVLKAITRYATTGFGVAETLSRLTSTHLFEVDLLKACGSKKLDKIVRALDWGEIHLEIAPYGEIGFPFLVFELADGDTHKLRNSMRTLDTAWWLRTLHQVSVGLQQLHGIDVAHLDVKPSNVVFFGANNAKVADLGRAVRKGVSSLNDQKVCAGALIHAPPEKLYGHIATDWAERHLATDLY